MQHTAELSKQIFNLRHIILWCFFKQSIQYIFHVHSVLQYLKHKFKKSQYTGNNLLMCLILNSVTGKHTYYEYVQYFKTLKLSIHSEPILTC